jgi:hypothetical protein
MLRRRWSRANREGRIAGNIWCMMRYATGHSEAERKYVAVDPGFE